MDLSIKNINNLPHHLALTARGALMGGESTKEEILEHIRKKGNEEFEKAFSMTDIEVCIQMLHEISESGGMDAMLEALKGEDK